MEGDARQELKAAGVPDSHLNTALQSLLRGMKLPTAVALREADAEIFHEARTYFGVLLAHDGRWSVRSDGIAFSRDVPPAEIERFNRAVDRISALSQEQERLTAVFTSEALAQQRADAPGR